MSDSNGLLVKYCVCQIRLIGRTYRLINLTYTHLQRSFPIQTSGHIEEPVAEEEQPQTESSDSKTAASDNMLPKNFLELIAIQKSQKESKLAPAPLAASSLTTSERLQ
ncbi:hypothetical protein HYC85_029484 [Camellia sinensis]|uniref:Uncharacterized protein n=1 Tax=Camellia sinensis TaxID=4442 RepID=A0A7J7FY32_CAMSI|nr:hypothetical protein HYC85_029484 [Camellia sinensis]